MPNFNDLNNMDIPSLASQCKAETEKFFRQLANDSRYCFELFCRACRDQADDALYQIYKLYIPILGNHAKKHPAFDQSSRDASSFAHVALTNFFFAVRGEKFLQMFSSLARVISYLHSCVSSEILQDIRKHHRETELGENPFTASSFSENILRDLLEYVRQVLVDEKDRFLFDLRFVLEMKPAEIVERYGATWETTREVSIHLYHIRQRLRQDPHLRSLIDPDE